MNEPCSSEMKYVISYTWIKHGRGTCDMAAFANKNDAIRYLKDHVDDNVNLQWSIRKEDAFLLT